MSITKSLTDGSVKVTVEELTPRTVISILKIAVSIRQEADGTGEFDLSKLFNNFETVVAAIDQTVTITAQGDKDITSVIDLPFSQIDELFEIIKEVNPSFLEKLKMMGLDLDNMDLQGVLT